MQRGLRRLASATCSKKMAAPGTGRLFFVVRDLLIRTCPGLEAKPGAPGPARGGAFTRSNSVASQQRSSRVNIRLVEA
jgi:hypothetical protein